MSAELLTTELEAAHLAWIDARERAVAAQEAIDWISYDGFGLLPDDAASATTAASSTDPLEPGHRPLEIALARRMATGDVETRYFERHDRTPTTDQHTGTNGSTSASSNPGA